MQLLPPSAYPYTPISSLATKFLHLSAISMSSSVNAVCWTMGGKRCITGTMAGELYLWSGKEFQYEMKMQVRGVWGVGVAGG